MCRGTPANPDLSTGATDGDGRESDYRTIGSATHNATNGDSDTHRTASNQHPRSADSNSWFGRDSAEHRRPHSHTDHRACRG